jgi:hypothetical protein
MSWKEGKGRLVTGGNTIIANKDNQEGTTLPKMQGLAVYKVDLKLVRP